MASEDETHPEQLHNTREFGEALTRLRLRAGLSVRQVAAKIGVPRATVGDYFAGRSLPTVAMSSVLPRVLRELGVTDPEPWEQALARLRRAPGPARADAEAPYRGLDPFHVSHAAWFHGREQESAAAADLIRSRAGTGLPVVVTGASGVGKSSLVHAGVLPRLTGRRWITATPGDDPFGRLAAAITDDRLDDAEAALRAARPRELLGTAQVVIVVDQCEELFAADGAEEDSYVAALAALAAVPDVAVVIVLRSDFYERAIRHEVIAAALRAPNVVISPMSEEQVRAAIVGPAQYARLSIDDGLVELLLRDFHPHGQSEPGDLPLLSHTLLQTWLASDRRTLSIAAYQATGGVADAVERSAESVVAALSDVQHEAARALFLRLVRQMEDTVVCVRRTVRWQDMPAMVKDFPDVAERFIAARLVTAVDDTLRISHESLVLAWRRLHDWLVLDREVQRVHRRAQTATAIWVESGRDPGSLYRGTPLAELREWAAVEGRTAELNDDERDFLTAAVAEHDSNVLRERRRIRSLRRWIAALVVACAVASSLTAVVIRLRGQAITERDLAISRQAALRATALADSDPPVAGLLAVAAHRVAATPEARSAVLNAAASPPATRVRASAGTLAVAASADGRLVVTGSSDGHIRLWRRDGDRLDPFGDAVRVSEQSLFAIAVDRHSRLVATTGLDGKVHLVDISDPSRPRESASPALSGTGYGLAFSPDEQWLVVAGERGLLVWDRTNSVPAHVHETDSAVKAVAFSPDGSTLASGGPGRPLQLRTVPEFEVLHDFDDETGTESLAFAPDNQTLAVGARDRSVHLRDLRTFAAAKPLTGFTGFVYAVAFSADGTSLTAGSSDSTARVWELPSGRELVSLSHPGPVTMVISTADQLITAAADGHARLWTLPGRRLPGLLGPVATVLFTPDSRSLITASTGSDATGNSGGGQRWDITDQRQPRRTGPALSLPEAPKSAGTAAMSSAGLLALGSLDGGVDLWRNGTRIGKRLPGTTGVVQSVAFSPDGRVMAVGGDDEQVRLWNVSVPEFPELLSVLTDPSGVVLSVGMSPDGSLLAASSADYAAYVWDISNPVQPRLLRKLTGHTNYAYSVAFSPDSTLLAVGSADKTITLWSTQDRAFIKRVGPTLTGPGNYVYSVAFTPDGTRLVAGSTDSTVRFWEVQNPDVPMPITTLRTGSPVFSVGVSPDGSTVAAGLSDGTVRLWPTNTDRAVAELCAVPRTMLSEEEWRTYMPDQGFGDPCDPAFPDGG